MLDCYHEVVAVDFEFIATPGNRPIPVCLVAHELRSGRRFRVWQDQFGPAPPYATGPDALPKLTNMPSGRRQSSDAGNVVLPTPS